MTNQEASEMLCSAKMYLLMRDAAPPVQSLTILDDAERVVLAEWELERAMQMQAHFLTSLRSLSIAA